jgi:hypothetical protein
MTPRITLITALAAAALVFAVQPASADPWGADAQQQRADFWNYDENGTKITDSSPGMSANDVAQLYSSGAHATGTNAIEIRERALGPERHLGATPVLDARERAFATKRVDTVPTDTRPLVGDGGDRFRIDPTSTPVAVGSIDSGREIEWPQVGFGVGLGVLFALGLMFLIRTTRSRELAH